MQTDPHGNKGEALEDEILIEDDEELVEPREAARAPWRVLVVDDDDGVHQSTRFAVQDATIFGRNVELVHAKSASEAMRILEADSAFELAIVDVVMESKHAGLDLSKWMRQQPSLRETRILLRTGQPGEVGEEGLVERYKIDDFRLKSELSRQRLITAMSSLLRSWLSSQELERSAKYMGVLAIKASLLIQSKSPEELSIRMGEAIKEIVDAKGVAIRIRKSNESPSWAYCEGVNKEQVPFDEMQEATSEPGSAWIEDDGDAARVKIVSKAKTQVEVWTSFADAGEVQIYSRSQCLDVLAQSALASLESIEALAALSRQAYEDEATGLPNAQALKSELASRLAHGEEVCLCALTLEGESPMEEATPPACLKWLSDCASSMLGRLPDLAKVHRFKSQTLAWISAGGEPGGLATCEEALAVGRRAPGFNENCECFSAAAPSAGLADADEMMARLELALLEARRQIDSKPMALRKSQEEIDKWRLKAAVFKQALEMQNFRPALRKLVSGDRVEWRFGLDLGWPEADSGWLKHAKARRIASSLGLAAEFDLLCARSAMAMATGLDGKVWVELGLDSLRKPGFMEEISALSKSAANTAGSSLGWLIPEDDLFWGVHGYDKWIGELSSHGVELGLSNFGLGYSALAKLGNSPWKALWLHPRLTSGSISDEATSDARLLRASFGLCQAFGFEVVCLRPESISDHRALEALSMQYGNGKLWTLEPGPKVGGGQ